MAAPTGRGVFSGQMRRSLPASLLGQDPGSSLLLDERSRPDFRDLYGRHAAAAASLCAAVRRVRLGGIDLEAEEIGRLQSLRLLVGEANALDLSAEADTLAADPSRRARLSMLAALLDDGRLEVRVAPLAGWSPDFSVFLPPSDVSGGGARGAPPGPIRSHAPILMVGTHWFERPFPHPGPALGAVFHGEPALVAFRRFEETWRTGHDLAGPIRAILKDALDRTAVRLRPG